MLLQVKATKLHGEWLPWLEGAIERGELSFGVRQAQKYIRRASNTNSSSYLEAPVIQEALEIFSDKEPEAEAQETPIDVEAERKAREAAEAKAEAERQARLVAEQRSKEWNEQYIKERDEKRAAEQKALALESQTNKEPEVVIKEVEKIPEDYESAKRQVSELQEQTEALQKQLADLKKQQDKIINDQVKSKLQGYQSELDKLEADKKAIEEIVDRKKAYLDSLSSEVKRIETHQSVINGVRLELISLAAFLNDIDAISDKDTISKWLALANMCDEAHKAIYMVFGQHGTGLRKAA